MLAPATPSLTCEPSQAATGRALAVGSWCAAGGVINPDCRFDLAFARRSRLTARSGRVANEVSQLWATGELIAVPDPVPLAGSYQEYARRCEQRRRLLDRVSQARVCAQSALNVGASAIRDGRNALCWGGRCDRRANRWASGLRPDRVVRRLRTWRAVSHHRGGHGSANGRLHRCRHGRSPAHQATGRAFAIGPKLLRRRVGARRFATARSARRRRVSSPTCLLAALELLGPLGRDNDNCSAAQAAVRGASASRLVCRLCGSDRSVAASR